MKLKIIEERLKKYETALAGTDLQAIREITQELSIDRDWYIAKMKNRIENTNCGKGK
ncbi:MAG TPA: hypothetical protein GXZ47_08270 [Treponema sp.]|nr:hypothetical protein [Treponema sp.]HKL85743.1 hypothetical protein [Treponemataceae bacterium]